MGRKALPEVPTSELRVGDTVLLDMSEPYYTCQTVKRVTEREVWFFRPYVHTSGFVTTDGVICYIGIEEYAVDRQSPFTYALVRRGEVA